MEVFLQYWPWSSRPGNCVNSHIKGKRKIRRRANNTRQASLPFAQHMFYKSGISTVSCIFKDPSPSAHCPFFLCHLPSGGFAARMSNSLFYMAVNVIEPQWYAKLSPSPIWITSVVLVLYFNTEDLVVLFFIFETLWLWALQLYTSDWDYEINVSLFQMMKSWNHAFGDHLEITLLYHMPQQMGPHILLGPNQNVKGIHHTNHQDLSLVEKVVAVDWCNPDSAIALVLSGDASDEEDFSHGAPDGPFLSHYSRRVCGIYCSCMPCFSLEACMLIANTHQVGQSRISPRGMHCNIRLLHQLLRIEKTNDQLCDTWLWHYKHTHTHTTDTVKSFSPLFVLVSFFHSSLRAPRHRT